jgi:hypothetical protein
MSASPFQTFLADLATQPHAGRRTGGSPMRRADAMSVTRREPAGVKAACLEREFAPRGVRPGDGLLLAPSDALALVDRAADEGVPIVTVEGLLRRGAAAPSRAGHLADFSARVAEGHGCWEDADVFIRARSHLGLVFEVTLGSDPLEAV